MSCANTVLLALFYVYLCTKQLFFSNDVGVTLKVYYCLGCNSFLLNAMFVTVCVVENVLGYYGFTLIFVYNSSGFKNILHVEYVHTTFQINADFL